MKSKNTRPAFRPLAMESLEARLPMAGDIWVSAKGTLKVTGDANNNSIAIVQTANANEYQIFANGGETIKRKGQPDQVGGSILVQGITKGIVVNLKAGNDIVHVAGQGVAVAGAPNLKITTAAGNDEVNVHDVLFAGKFSVSTGKATGGGDTVTLTNVNLTGKSASVTTSDGNDQLFFTNTIAKNAKISAGAGNDAAFVNVVTVDRATVNMGKGNDQLTLNGALTLNGPKKTKILGGKAEVDLISNVANLSAGSSAFLADPTLTKSGWETIV